MSGETRHGIWEQLLQQVVGQLQTITSCIRPKWKYTGELQLIRIIRIRIISFCQHSTYSYNLLILLLLLLHISPPLCGVDVSCETPPSRPVLHVLPWQFSLSLTSRSWWYPTTSASAFLSFFSPAPPSPSLSCLRICLLFSIHAHTISTYSHALSWIFLTPRRPSNYFIPYNGNV